MKKELTRAEWIAELEELCLILAREGKEYAHVYSDMQTQTDKLLSGDEGRCFSVSSEDIGNGDKIYKEFTNPAADMFLNIKIGDILCVLATESMDAERLRSRLTLAVSVFNDTHKLNHIYSSHKDEYGVKFTRVG